MRYRGISTAIAVACLAMMLGACRYDFWHSTPPAPVGQVVATVGNHEITTRQLQAELAAANITDPKRMKEAQTAALQLIIKRTILADRAKELGVDSDPDFAIRKDRADQIVLIEGFEAKIARDVPLPTQEEAEEFVSDHPDIFGQRKIFTIDQIRFRRPNDPTFAQKLKPIKTMDGIVALLNTEGIAFARATNKLDAVGQDPRLIAAIVKLPPQEVFAIASGTDLMIDQIKDVAVVPFTGQVATNYALNIIKNQRIQEAISKTLGETIRKGAATVRMNKSYLPAATPGQKPAVP